MLTLSRAAMPERQPRAMCMLTCGDAFGSSTTHGDSQRKSRRSRHIAQRQMWNAACRDSYTKATRTQTRLQIWVARCTHPIWRWRESVCVRSRLCRLLPNPAPSSTRGLWLLPTILPFATVAHRHDVRHAISQFLCPADALHGTPSLPLAADFAACGARAPVERSWRCQLLRVQTAPAIAHGRQAGCTDARGVALSPADGQSALP